MTERICSIDGCGLRHYCRGWCKYHYERWQRHGDPMGGGPRRSRATPFDRVMSRAAPVGACIEFLGARSAKGYGQVRVGGALRYAHRIVAEHHFGPAPEDRPIVLHSCDNPACVNVTHLRYGTVSENGIEAYARGRR